MIMAPPSKMISASSRCIFTIIPGSTFPITAEIWPSSWNPSFNYHQHHLNSTSSPTAWAALSFAAPAISPRDPAIAGNISFRKSSSWVHHITGRCWRKAETGSRSSPESVPTAPPLPDWVRSEVRALPTFATLMCWRTIGRDATDSSAQGIVASH